MEERRRTDPMIRELIIKVDRLDVKLDNHMADEEHQLSDIADNKHRVDELHDKMDQILDFAPVWNDLKGFARVMKWATALLAAVGTGVAGIMNWPSGSH